jgi:hypothetical protein
MNALKYRVFRYFAIATLFVIGVATTIATGGGSSGGMPGVGPPAATGPSLAITSANGEEVASAVIIAIGTSFDLGDISGDDIAVQAAEGPVAAPGSLSSANVYAKFLPAYAMAAENCANGGTVEVTATVADPTTPTVGDRIIAVFDNCDDNEGYVISGTVDLTIAAIQGDVLTDVFLLGLDVVLTDIVMIDGTETITASGQFMLTLDNLDFPVLALSLAGDQLQFGAAGQAITLTNFDHSLQVDTGVIPETKLAEVFGRLDSQSLGGTVDYETPILVQAIGDFDPHSGRILVTGANDSSVLINIFDSTRITLEIDTNGDGVIDEYVDTTWAALSGQSASTNSSATINSSTAPILAREVFNAVTGFGSLTVTAGTKFAPLAPFGQLESLGVSGDFGPMEVACNMSGTATVSGFKATTNTFSANDQLTTIFDVCEHGEEVLSGEMNFTVNSFDQPPGDAYVVTGTVSETDLHRTFGGNCFSGLGTFDTSYDFVFTSTGIIYMDSSTTSFIVSAGGRSQQLSGAMVDAQIMLGEPPLTVTRQSFGSVTSEDLDGRFSYQSVSPDVFLLDESAATGPYSGELMVTAGDNSTMRMVALDEFNVRLELDFNSDSVIDYETTTTWAALAYPGWICG